LSPVFSEALRHSLPTNNAVINDHKAVELPFKVMNPKKRADLEAAMLIMVNKERVKRGLKTLKADPELACVARKHAIDMFARSYFSHYTPEKVDPFGRMRADGVVFFTAGENLALAQTLSIAHNGLMNSPGHRANILNPAFGRLGVGIVDGGIYGLMITQNFRN
ncbi:MAG TPA: CAP domain-containing protein, partial [Pedobacter sp.]